MIMIKETEVVREGFELAFHVKRTKSTTPEPYMQQRLY